MIKKIFLILVALALSSSLTLKAQQHNDTTGTASESGTRQQDMQYQQPGQQTDRFQDPYVSEGMVIITKDEIPPSLKETLKDGKYEGWANGTIYHNTRTGEYMIAPPAYRFNKQGEEVEWRTTTGSGNRDGRESRYSRDENIQGQNRTQNAQQDAQHQAREQMGEIPTSATKDQQDTTRGPSTGYRNEQNEAPDVNSQSQPDHGTGDNFRTDDMTEIHAKQIPATLRRTLSEKQYEGWEDKGTLYEDPATNEYVLVIDTPDKASQRRAYRFDKNGQLKESQNGTTRMNDQ